MRTQEKDAQALATGRRTNVGLLLIFVTRIKTGHFVVDFLKRAGDPLPHPSLAFPRHPFPPVPIRLHKSPSHTHSLTHSFFPRCQHESWVPSRETRSEPKRIHSQLIPCREGASTGGYGRCCSRYGHKSSRYVYPGPVFHPVQLLKSYNDLTHTHTYLPFITIARHGTSYTIPPRHPHQKSEIRGEL